MNLTHVTETYTQLGRLERLQSGGGSNSQALTSKREREDETHQRSEPVSLVLAASLPSAESDGCRTMESALELTDNIRQGIMAMEPSSLSTFLQDPSKVRMISSRYV